MASAAGGWRRRKREPRSMVWGGQFENQERANQRLALVLPVSIAIIFALLFATFEKVGQSMLILFDVPFALVGGIAALWIRGINLNLSASIGFIALFGVAVLNGIVMVSHINLLRTQGLRMYRAVLEGATDRLLRPVLMTALVANPRFIPMATATSTGGSPTTSRNGGHRRLDHGYSPNAVSAAAAVSVV